MLAGPLARHHGQGGSRSLIHSHHRQQAAQETEAAVPDGSIVSTLQESVDSTAVTPYTDGDFVSNSLPGQTPAQDAATPTLPAIISCLTCTEVAAEPVTTDSQDSVAEEQVKVRIANEHLLVALPRLTLTDRASEKNPGDCHNHCGICAT